MRSSVSPVCFRVRDGAAGLVIAPRGRLFRALRFILAHGKIARVEVIGDPERLRQLDLAVLAP
jgi:hypothetical protein